MKERLDQLEWAKEQIERIKADRKKNKDIRYLDRVRPIANFRDMMESSCKLYGDTVAIYYKINKSDKEFLSMTYNEYYERIKALGTKLLMLGLKDEKIAIIGENSYMWGTSYLAVTCGAGVVVPIDRELEYNEIKNIIEATEASAVIMDSKYKEIFTRMRDEDDVPLKAIIDMNNEVYDEDNDVLSYEALVNEGKKEIEKGNTEYLEADIDNEKLSIILYTSGTTGVSKGVMLSQKNICTVIMSAPTYLQIKDGEKFFSVLPIHHTYECTCGFLIPLFEGSSIIYPGGLRYLVQDLQASKPNIILGVPLIFESLISKIWKTARKKGKEKQLKKAIKINNKLKKIGIDLSKKLFKDIVKIFGGQQRTFVTGGAPITKEVVQSYNAFGINIVQGYGLTEASPIVALNPDVLPYKGSAGKVLPLVEGKVHNPNAEGIGELCFKGDNIMHGYYKMEDKTAEVLRDGWYHTGDLGYIDKDGYVFITGRQKNVIITKNGKNVYPEEIEANLQMHDVILESFVWSLEGEQGQDSTIVATVRVDDENVENILGSTYTDEMVKDLLWEYVDEYNKKVPLYKKVMKLNYRKEEFIMTTAKKIKRNVDENKRGI